MVHPNYDPKDKESDNEGTPRAQVGFEKLRELWFHTGTNCNLSCNGCFEDAGPGDERLLQPTLDDIVPYVDEAVELGATSFNFTGGEPFVNPSILEMIEYCLQRANVLVLTNGTRPFMDNVDEALHISKKYLFDLAFRVSLDNSDRNITELIRGKGMYDRALSSILLLQVEGSPVYVAARKNATDNETELRRVYQDLLGDIPVVFFPELDPAQSLPTITPDCITRYKTPEIVSQWMCTYTRQVVKKPEGMRVIACTVTNDNPNFDYGPSLKQSLERKTYLAHHRCFTMCFAGNASCSK